MFKLGIFEDERIILDSLCNYINWEDYGCKVVCSSFCGTDILDLINRHHPDIVITDIQMGNVNGLDICEYLQVNYPDTQKIIITGFGKIDYARRAFKSSVIDFILKPIDRQELIETVLKATIQLSQLLDSENKKIQVNAQLIEHFLMELAGTNYISEQKAAAQIEELDIELHTYFCLGIYIDHNNADTQDVKIFIDFWKRILSQPKAMDCFQLKYCFYLSHHLYAVFDMENDNPPEISLLYKTILTHMYYLLQQYSEQFHEQIFLFYSDIYWYTADLITCIKQLNQLFEQKFFLEPNSIVHADKLHSHEGETIHSPQDCFYPLAASIINSDQLKLQYWFHEMQQCLCHYSEEDVKFKYIEFFIYLKEHLKPYKINIDELMSTKQLIAAFKNRYTFSQINMLISNLLEISYNQREENIKNNQSISYQIQKYIERNYALPLSAKVIAAEFHYNPKYLSAVVKKETDMSINDLIVKIRIEKAISMMANPSLKTYQIAEKIGIPDARYFSQVFKKMTGMTPKEYRVFHTLTP